MSFTHLHVHSEYSLLDGFSNIKKLVKRAVEMGMPAIALTDHGTMFGVMDFYNAAKAAGIKPILGVESYMAARGMKDKESQYDKRSSHILLLAENQAGYQNLLKIASTAQLDGYYYYPRTDHEFLAAHSEGVICTSGCMSAEVPRMIAQGNLDAARKQLDWYYDVFGKERFFFELQVHNLKELDEINKNLLLLGKRYEARFVATNDVHYINEEDSRFQDILLAIQMGKLLSDPDRMRMTDSSYYLRSPEEMARLFAEVPEAISNTLLIAERCNVNLDFQGYHLPNFPVPQDCDAESYLRSLCEEGLRKKYAERAVETIYQDRLNYELGVIHTMGFDTYFLIVWDLCTYARSRDIWYNARGSAAGSMVAYCLDITRVDPISHGLIFERFLNPGRISMPDIDLDFRDDRRSEMLSYCAQKYGDDKVAAIITFGTLGAKAAIRDVGRVMDIPLPEVDRVAKLIPAIPGKPITVMQALEEVPDLKKLYESEGFLKELIDTASKMEGVVRNAGTHAAGVVIADKPVVEYLPLHRPTSGSAEDSPIKAVTQFEMNILDGLGMLKVDFLGLATLTIMARACALIEQRHGIEFTLDNIPVDDPATYELLGRGDTMGVFQVEGNGMRRWLMQMKPKELANVIAMVALFRPGPMDFIPGYIRRMHGEEQVEYRHPLLEPIFKETYGYPVYQEQLMFAAVQLAGYTQSEADDLRKAIAKKIKDKLLKHREKFVKGAKKIDIPEETAAAIFDDWEEFARYGFNKCLPGETEIIDATTGRLVKIEDLYYERAELRETVTCDTGTFRLETGHVARVMNNGVKPVYRLTTALGRQIEATANHPFYTYDGWQILDRLQAGDLIAVPRRLPTNGCQEWPTHEVIALGHLLAEGNLCHPHSVYFYSQDLAQVDDFVQAAEQFENVKCSVAIHKGTYSIYARRVDRKCQPGIVPWAQALKIWGKNAPNKEIPAAVFQLTNAQIGLLLSRMWEGDGHIDVLGRSLFYATASERMARQVQHLLLRLGIISRLRQVTFPYKDGRLGYQLFVTHNRNLQVFAEKIGKYFVSDRRKAMLQTLIEQEFADGSTKDVVPMPVKELVRTAKERSGVTWTEMNAACGVAQREFYPAHTATKRGFNRQTIGRLAEYFGDPALQRYADNDVYWDEIVAIEYAGQKQTYDLEVPGLHNFVANDIIVHNSHAADYGIIAVQTGYLKAHYPVEYMTALMSVTKNETAKVAIYAADCRRMGIDVLPPDVNSSGWDFTIEDCPAEKGDGCRSVIRFGMGAIKNVGVGPVEAIAKARNDGGAFTDLNDFARRVDLRSVGKRALESMVKVGALDRFGTRPQLLAGLDQIISVSSSHFKAADSGQMSLFGAHTGVVEDIHLPPVMQEISRREILNWERELIGLYVSDHPLSPVMEQINQAVSHFSGQLADAAHGELVRVAGMVVRIRNHQTKTGKQMAFATLEDIQGNIELVVFPRTWEKYQAMLQLDQVVLVDGKIDNPDGGEPKILVDTVGTEFKYVTPLQSAPSALELPPDPWMTESSESRVSELPWQRGDQANKNAKAEGKQQPARLAASSPAKTTAAPVPQDVAAPVASPVRPAGQVAQPSASKAAAVKPSASRPASLPPEMPPKIAEANTTYDGSGPPPPDNFPDDWGVTEMVPDGFVLEGTRSVPLPALPLAAKAENLVEAEEPEESGWPDMPAATQVVVTALSVASASPAFAESAIPPEHEPVPAQPSTPNLVPYLLTPQASAADEEIHMLTISMRSCGDKVRDNLKLRQAFGVLFSYPGNDRFAFMVYERGRGYRIEFPNFTTRLCPELTARLYQLVNAENVRIEPLLLH